MKVMAVTTIPNKTELQIKPGFSPKPAKHMKKPPTGQEESPSPSASPSPSVEPTTPSPSMQLLKK
jgi:hypothetical protein